MRQAVSFIPKNAMAVKAYFLINIKFYQFTSLNS